MVAACTHARASPAQSGRAILTRERARATHPMPDWMLQKLRSGPLFGICVLRRLSSGCVIRKCNASLRRMVLTNYSRNSPNARTSSRKLHNHVKVGRCPKLPKPDLPEMPKASAHTPSIPACNMALLPCFLCPSHPSTMASRRPAAEALSHDTTTRAATAGPGSEGRGPVNPYPSWRGHALANGATAQPGAAARGKCHAPKHATFAAAKPACLGVRPARPAERGTWQQPWRTGATQRTTARNELAGTRADRLPTACHARRGTQQPGPTGAETLTSAMESREHAAAATRPPYGQRQPTGALTWLATAGPLAAASAAAFPSQSSRDIETPKASSSARPGLQGNGPQLHAQPQTSPWRHIHSQQPPSGHRSLQPLSRRGHHLSTARGLWTRARARDNTPSHPIVPSNRPSPPAKQRAHRLNRTTINIKDEGRPPPAGWASRPAACALRSNARPSGRTPRNRSATSEYSNPHRSQNPRGG